MPTQKLIRVKFSEKPREALVVLEILCFENDASALLNQIVSLSASATPQILCSAVRNTVVVGNERPEHKS